MNNLFIIIIIAASSLVFGQVSAKISFNTGDAEVDTHLNEVNVYASTDIPLFREDLRLKFKASDHEMDTYLVKEKVRPADVYYGYVITSVTGRSFPEVMKMYKEKNGWGSIAKQLRIKPGSEQFHALKNTTMKSIGKDKMKGVNKNKQTPSQKEKGNKKIK